jgi:hypothetical protein
LTTPVVSDDAPTVRTAAPEPTPAPADAPLTPAATRPAVKPAKVVPVGDPTVRTQVSVDTDEFRARADTGRMGARKMRPAVVRKPAPVAPRRRRLLWWLVGGAALVLVLAVLAFLFLGRIRAAFDGLTKWPPRIAHRPDCPKVLPGDSRIMPFC